MFEKTVLTFYPLFENAPGLPVPHAHNLFLQMGVEFGIGGLVAFVSFVVAVLLAGADAMRHARDSAQGWLAAGLTAGFVVYLVHGLVDAVGTSTKVSVIIWFMVALLMVAHRRVMAARRGAVEWNR
jgi:putative inorganic carbon (HCO3(-)) transporter